MQEGHKVTVTTRFPSTQDSTRWAQEQGLAKRLFKVKDNQGHEWGLWEGKTSWGLELVLLDGPLMIDGRESTGGVGNPLEACITVAKDKKADAVHGWEIQDTRFVASFDLTIVSNENTGLREAIAQDNKIRACEGLDASLWNPGTDPYLPARYDWTDSMLQLKGGKSRCKAALQQSHGLHVSTKPMFVIETSQSKEKLVEQLSQEFFRFDVSCLFVSAASSGFDTLTRESMDYLSTRYEGQVGYATKSVTEAQLHQWMAGADAWLCLDDAVVSDRVLQGLRYGTLPIIEKKAPFDSKWVHCEPKMSTGNVVFFDTHTAESIATAMVYALRGLEAPGHARLRYNLMREDHSWLKVVKQILNPANETNA